MKNKIATSLLLIVLFSSCSLKKRTCMKGYYLAYINKVEATMNQKYTTNQPGSANPLERNQLK